MNGSPVFLFVVLRNKVKLAVRRRLAGLEQQQAMERERMRIAGEELILFRSGAENAFRSPANRCSPGSPRACAAC